MKMQELQKGMSMGQMMGLLVLIGFVATAAINMVPYYIDNSTVTSTLQSVQEAYASADISSVTNEEIKRKIDANFQVNMTSDEIAKAVKIIRNKGDVKVTINYVIQRPFMGNVDVVMKFDNEVKLGR